MKNFLLLLSLTFISTAFYGQIKVNPTLFDYAKNTPASVEKNYRSLAEYLKEPAQNDREVVETIFYWMAINIAYNDNPEFERPYGDSIAKTTLMTKKSGCEGTARLFYEICHAAGIECQIIFGFAEGYSFDEQQQTTPNHGWNAVLIDGEWKLVDATWGSGGSTEIGNREVYVSELDMRYFFANPKDFIIDHYPEDAKWQLLDEPISRREFYSDEFELKRLAKLGW